MPRGQNALGNRELQTISNWINQGAKFDGDSEDTALSDLAAMEENDPSIIIPKPTGNETVSFTRDIAPFMANLCVGCHSGNNLNGGLSLVSFYDMMKGGDSGRVVLPGNVNGSRLYRLVGGLENPRMPQGQARITRKNYEDLTKWFEEGNTFDGDNPREPLRNFVMSTAEMAADRFAQMSVDEFNKFRIDRSEAQMKKALPNDAFTTLQSDDFLLIGNVSAARLRAVDEWAQEHARSLRQTFRAPSEQIWKGRLAIFVLKDRFSFEEFALTTAGIQAPEEMTGHAVVTNNYEDAYIVFQDVGDESTAEQPSSRVMLIDHMTGAYLKRGGGTLPDWVIRGTGLALAAKTLRGDAYLRGLDNIAGEQVRALGRPEDVFADGTFSPGTIGPVGYSLVNYMLSASSAKFGELISVLAEGRDTAAAVRQVYNTDLSALARGYLASVRR